MSRFRIMNPRSTVGKILSELRDGGGGHSAGKNPYSLISTKSQSTVSCADSWLPTIQDGSTGYQKLAEDLRFLYNKGQIARAVDLLLSREDKIESSRHISSDVYIGLLKACSKSRARTQAQQIHAFFSRQNVEISGVLADHLVTALASCGLLGNAYEVLCSMPHRSIYSWTRMISGYIAQGQGCEALKMLHLMQLEGIEPDECTFLNLFKACALLHDIIEAKKLHMAALKKGFTSDIFVASALVSMYGKCGSFVEAESVFCALSEHNVVTWTAMLSAYVEERQGEKALQLFRQMQQEGVSIDEWVLVMAFQACGMVAANDGSMVEVSSMPLEIGQALHSDAQRKHYTSDVFVQSSLISMYGKCRSILLAEMVFNGLLECETVSWSAILSVYLDQQQPQKTLHMYMQMQEEGISINHQTFLLALQACNDLAENREFHFTGWVTEAIVLKIGKALHIDAQRNDFMKDVFVGSTLVNLYSKCGSIEEAQRVFETLQTHDAVSWSIMLSAYVEHGLGEKALCLYRQMQEEGMEPTKQTYVAVLQACGNLVGKQKGNLGGRQYNQVTLLRIVQALHVDAYRRGFTSDIFLNNTLVCVYGKCGGITYAENMFVRLTKRDIVTWNVMLLAYMEHDQGRMALCLYRQMQLEGVSPSKQTVMFGLQACGSVGQGQLVIEDGQMSQATLLEIGQAILADGLKDGLIIDAFVCSTLVTMYGKCGSLLEAESVFAHRSNHDAVLWSALLSVYVEQDQGEKALRLYRQMVEEGSSPNLQTYILILQACLTLLGKGETLLKDGCDMPLEIVQAVHADAQSKGFMTDTRISSALLKFFAKIGKMMDAMNVFGKLYDHDTISWNAVLSAFLEYGQGNMVLQLYRQMHEEGISPDQQTMLIALQACNILLEQTEVRVRGWLPCPVVLNIGRALHVDAWSKGLVKDVFVANTLIDMYGKCGSVVEAESVFDRLSNCTIVTWNVMLSSYVKQGKGGTALQLYMQMQEEGVSPSQQTVVIAVQACRALLDTGHLNHVVSLEISRALHIDACRKGFGSNSFVASTLVSMYGKCGSIAEAEKVFDRLLEHNTVALNAMLSVYLEQGREDNAMHFYRQMRKKGVPLDDITIVCALAACRSTGSAEFCKELHFDVIFMGYDLNPILGTVLFRAYSHCAHMIDAQSVFDRLVQHDVACWTACIAGYAQEGNSLASLQTFEKMQLAGTKPNEITFLSVLSACNHAGFSDKGVELLGLMNKDYGLSPSLEHYITVIDLLGRVGKFEELEEVLFNMPVQADWATWMSVLAACRTYGKLDLAKKAFDHAVRLEPKEAVAYALMSEIFINAGLQFCADEVENLRLVKGTWKS